MDFRGVFFARKLLVVISFLEIARNSRADLRTRLKEVNVEAVFPNDPDYNRLSRPYNLRFDYKPAAFAFPRSTGHLAMIMPAAGAEGIPVSVRSGGHSYTAQAYGGKDGFLVIDMSKMKKLTLDSTGIAIIQAGNLVADVAQGLFNAGKKAVPTGTCPLVGIGGLASFGGFGFNSRAWGLTLDSVIGHEVVLANGSVVNVSEDEHSDLFWALRGAGASFGIISAFKMRTFDAPSVMTYFSFTWQFNSADELSQAISDYQNYCLIADLRPDIGMESNLGKGDSSDQISFQILGTVIGPISGLDLLGPILAKLPKNPMKKVNETSWISTLNLLAGTETLEVTSSALEKNHALFYAKSLVTPQEQPATLASLNALARYLFKEGASSSLDWFVQLQLYGGKGSFINSVPKESSAYVHRSALWTIQFYASSGAKETPFPLAGFGFLEKMVESLTNNNPKDWAGGYLNYDDDKLADDVWPSFYYGDNYDRLRRIKTTYDPQNLFRYSQAIQIYNNSTLGESSKDSQLGAPSTSPKHKELGVAKGFPPLFRDRIM